MFRFSLFVKDVRSTAVRKAQLADCTGLARIAVLGSLFNLVVTVVTVWSESYAPALAGWIVAAVAAAMLRLFCASRIAGRVFDEAALDAAERTTVLIAVLNGTIWGAGVLGGSFVLDAAHFGIVMILVGGMMGAAVMTYGAVPRAALGYIAAIALGAALAFVVSPHASLGAVFLLASYVVVLIRTIASNETNFIVRIETEASLRESAATVRLLLNDFEQQSADWLWETDAWGRIRGPSDRFAEACRRDRELLGGASMAELFDASRERTLLEDHLRRGHAFRGLTLQLTVDGQPCWWTLSASAREGGGMRGVASDVTGQKRAEARVSHMAHYDGLTDLANRFLFNETLRRALKRQRGNGRVAVLCLDLDQFKSVNDTLGHPVGDRLLCEVARRIEGVVRGTDLIARLGGDEFAVLMTRLNAVEDVEHCAMRIIAAIAEPFVLDGMQVMTSASIGIAIAPPGESSGAELLKRADLALYAAKSGGRNRFAHFEPGMDEAARHRRALEMDLRAALVRGEFELYYQPLIDVESGRTVSYEALVRWNHRERGVIMPGDFIPLAEETGLIVQIGEWVIRQATSDIADWPDHLRVSINVSPAQMRSAHLVGTVMHAIASSGIDPGRLELEITESVLMHDSEVNIAILHKLRAFGVRIALDDFGTGYSSLNYLRAFPFDKIKIDRCFVETIDVNPDCQAIVRAVTSLARSLGMTTTAEGVENTRQMEELRSHGCTEVQGYLFARPLRAEEFTDLRRKPGISKPVGTDPAVRLLPVPQLSHFARICPREGLG